MCVDGAEHKLGLSPRTETMQTHQGNAMLGPSQAKDEFAEVLVGGQQQCLSFAPSSTTSSDTPGDSSAM